MSSTANKIMVSCLVVLLLTLWLLNIIPLIDVELRARDIGTYLYMILICAFRNEGFQDGTRTYGLVSGLIQSGISLGGFLGPATAGVLQDAVGFPWSASVCGFINLSMVGTCRLH